MFSKNSKSGSYLGCPYLSFISLELLAKSLEGLSIPHLFQVKSHSFLLAIVTCHSPAYIFSPASVSTTVHRLYELPKTSRMMSHKLNDHINFSVLSFGESKWTKPSCQHGSASCRTPGWILSCLLQAPSGDLASLTSLGLPLHVYSLLLSSSHSFAC